MEIQTKDHSGKLQPLKVFFEKDGYRIVLLHDGMPVLEKLFELLGEPERTIFVLSWSWYTDDNRAMTLRKTLERMAERFPMHEAAIRNNIIVCMNSASEHSRFRAIDPVTRCILVNNACFLSTELFGGALPALEQDAPGVLNAKCLYFKRHYLTAGLKRKIFVSYNEKNDRKSPLYCDIRSYEPEELHFDLSPEAVAALHGRAAFGMALSELEGACYASTEYLLCGLPVVSTPSLGGRDEFYGPLNSVITRPSPEGLLDAEDLVRKRIASGAFNRAAIRQGTLDRLHQFRRRLCDEIEKATGIDADVTKRHLDESCAANNKLSRFKNFWIKEVFRAEA
ncbi:hypothetical protein HMPREF9946_04990 [Acetobacteraceae bacterium AT-5844]|nr:hypothetical protein HMPREF9946_04990 [Acetobacteraceae bacterium AT-5844]